MMYDIVAIGSATRDNFLTVDYDLIDYPRSPSGKAFALPFGEKMEVRDAYFTIGGNAANAAVTFARYGLTTACVAKFGADIFGDDLGFRLKREGISTKLIKRTADRPTSFSTLLLQGGERTILGYHGASDIFKLADVDMKKMKSRWWYLSLSGESDELYLPLVEFAKQKGIRIAVNPSGHHISHRGAEIRSSLPDIAVLIVNTGEAASLAEMDFNDPPGVVKKLSSLMPAGTVVITDGPKGAKVISGGKIYSSGIFREKAVVDRTGCGDAFGAGFVAVMARGGTIPEAIRFASANATAVVEQIGGTEGILRRKDYEGDARWKDFPIKEGSAVI